MNFRDTLVSSLMVEQKELTKEIRESLAGHISNMLVFNEHRSCYVRIERGKESYKYHFDNRGDCRTTHLHIGNGYMKSVCDYLESNGFYWRFIFTKNEIGTKEIEISLFPLDKIGVEVEENVY